MSFKRNRNKVKFIKYTGGLVKPSYGCYTVYYWYKGNEIKYVKADIYGLDAEILVYGVLADTLPELIKRIKDMLCLTN
ncbi:MAG: hypothetical protein ACRC3J_01845 [Culicoidibacterales bacterium]